EALVVLGVQTERPLLQFRLREDGKRGGEIGIDLELDALRELVHRRRVDVAAIGRHPELGEIGRHAWVVRRHERDAHVLRGRLPGRRGGRDEEGGNEEKSGLRHYPAFSIGWCCAALSFACRAAPSASRIASGWTPPTASRAAMNAVSASSLRAAWRHRISIAASLKDVAEVKSSAEPVSAYTTA